MPSRRQPSPGLKQIPSPNGVHSPHLPPASSVPRVDRGRCHSATAPLAATSRPRPAPVDRPGRESADRRPRRSQSPGAHPSDARRSRHCIRGRGHADTDSQDDAGRHGVRCHRPVHSCVLPPYGMRDALLFRGCASSPAPHRELSCVCLHMLASCSRRRAVPRVAVPPVRDDTGVHTFATVSRRKYHVSLISTTHSCFTIVSSS